MSASEDCPAPSTGRRFADRARRRAHESGIPPEISRLRERSGWSALPPKIRKADRTDIKAAQESSALQDGVGARLIALLREPVERAYSHGWMYVSRGIEPRSLEEAVAENLKRPERGAGFQGPGAEDRLRENAPNLDRGRLIFRVHLDFGDYVGPLERFLALLPGEQLRVIDVDDFRSDPPAVTRRMRSFAGADPELDLGDLAPQNPARTLRQSPAFTQLRAWSLRTGAAERVPVGAKAGLWRAYSRRSKVPRMAPETARRLGAHHAAFNRRLAELLGDEAPSWTHTSV